MTLIRKRKVAKTPEPTQDLVKQFLNYDKKTGKCYWKKRLPEHFNCAEPEQQCKAFNSRFAGKVAGYVYQGPGWCRTRVNFNSATYDLDKLIWLHVYGWYPAYVWHINGNGLDNSVVNLSVTPPDTRSEASKINYAEAFNFFRRSGIEPA